MHDTEADRAKALGRSLLARVAAAADLPELSEHHSPAEILNIARIHVPLGDESRAIVNALQPVSAGSSTQYLAALGLLNEEDKKRLRARERVYEK